MQVMTVGALPNPTWSEAVGRTEQVWNPALNSGVGGWQTVFSDTGWRNITTVLDAAFRTSNPNAVVYLRRQNGLVSIHINETVAGSGVGTVAIMTPLPAGFLPSTISVVGVQTINSNTGVGTTESFYINASNLIGFGWTAIRHMAILSYPTNDAWPVSLPGVAAGSIPT